MQDQFKRQGINYLIKKYADLARIKNSELIPADFSPHKIRHTTVMGLVDSGVDLIYIRDLLGHVSVKTTEVYVRADASKKSGKMVQLLCHKSFLKMIVISFAEDVGLTHRVDHFKKLYGFFMPKIRKGDELILAEAKKFNQPIQTEQKTPGDKVSMLMR